MEKDTAKHFTYAGKAHWQAFAAVFAACEPFTSEAIEAALNAYVADNGLKFKEVAPPLRTALMGFMGGSHLSEIMAFLGKQETLARLQRAVGSRNQQKARLSACRRGWHVLAKVLALNRVCF